MTELPHLKDDQCSLSRSVHQQNVIHIHKDVCISVIKFWYVCLPRFQVGEIYCSVYHFCLSFLSAGLGGSVGSTSDAHSASD